MFISLMITFWIFASGQIYQPLVQNAGPDFFAAEVGTEEGRVLAASESLADEEPGSNWFSFLNKTSDNVADVVFKAAGEVDEEIKKIRIPSVFANGLSNRLPENPEKIIRPQKKIDAVELEIPARSAFAIDCENGVELFNKNQDQVAPMASITKLMTALVFLDYNPGWETIYQIQKQDRREGGRIYLYYGDEVTVKDLFYLSLVGSANTATVALVHSVGLSEQEFVQKMNDKALELELENTRFEDVVGLSDGNVSTASEIAFLAQKSLAQKDIRQAVLTKEYELVTQKGRSRMIFTTDYFLENFEQSILPSSVMIIGGKTGYTEAAGYCFVGQFREGEGKEIVTVVLGAQSDADRFSQTEKLAAWIYENYEW